MSTDYTLVCYTCKVEMDSCLASGSGFYGFKVWQDSIEEMKKWMGHGEAVGHHEGHDIRLVSEHVDLPWKD